MQLKIGEKKKQKLVNNPITKQMESMTNQHKEKLCHLTK